MILAPIAQLSEKKKKPWLLWYGVAVSFFIVDRFLKYLVITNVFFHPTTFFAFTLFKNKGIAFSLPLSSVIFWPVAICIFLFLGAFFLRLFRKEPLEASFLFCVFLGAASNLFDKYFYGAIIDYAIFFNRSAVNIADGMIIVGLIPFLFLRKK